MKSIEELARALVDRRAKRKALVQERAALFMECEYKTAEGKPCGIVWLKTTGRDDGDLCESCGNAIEMTNAIHLAGERVGAAMTALTKAVKRDAR